MGYDKLSIESWIELINKKDEEIKRLEGLVSFNYRASNTAHILIDRQTSQLTVAERALKRISDNWKNPMNIAKTALEKMDEIAENDAKIYREKKEKEQWLSPKDRKLI